MAARAIQPFILFLVGVLYWQAVSHVSGANEPWDAAGYWRIWYPGSLVMSAGAAFVSRGRQRRWGWLAGVIVTFAQLPVMWANTGLGAFSMVGVVILSVLAVPAVGVGWLIGRYATPPARSDGGTRDDGAI